MCQSRSLQTSEHFQASKQAGHKGKEEKERKEKKQQTSILLCRQAELSKQAKQETI
jgi:hypothetical protein